MTSTYESTYSTSASSEEAAAAIAAVFLIIFPIMFIFAIGTYVLTSLCLMRIFNKAGVAGWIAWVPFYNTWKLLEIGGQQGYWAVLSIIPLVNIVASVFILIAYYHIGKKLGKGGEFILWGIFLPIVWFIWLAFDKSTWDDSLSSAPSLVPTPTGAGSAPPVPPAAV